METDAHRRVVAEWLSGPELPELVRRRGPEVSLERGRPVTAVVGPRRCGKTYFLYQCIGDLLRTRRAERADILLVDFEDYRLSGFRPADMDGLLTAFQHLAGRAPRFLFLDEVQHVPGWARLLRTLHNQRRFALMISGSNADLLAAEIASELRGRYTDELMLPFSFSEFLAWRRLKLPAAAAYTPERGRLLAALDDYLRGGGFPEVLAQPREADRRKTLHAYYQTVFYRDLLDRHGARARHVLEPMMRQVLEDYALPFSVSAFGRRLAAAGLPGSKRTIANCLRHLEEVFFVSSIEKFSYAPRRRLMNPRKVYLVDTGFGLLGGAFSEKRGALLENAVAVELLRRQRRAFYFRDRRECDFILQEGTKASEAWQVCWELTLSNEEREIGGLLEAMESLGLRSGGILTYDQQETRRVRGRRIRVVPAWRWLLDLAGPV